MHFRWVAWNLDHIAEHGVGPGETEEVVEMARSPFPRRIEDDKWLVWGATLAGRQLQVVFVLDANGTVFVIHVRDLTAREKRRLRRR